MVEAQTAILTAAGGGPALGGGDADVAARHPAADESLVARADTVRIRRCSWRRCTEASRNRSAPSTCRGRNATRAAQMSPASQGFCVPVMQARTAAPVPCRPSVFRRRPPPIAVVGAATRGQASVSVPQELGAGAAISAALVRVRDGLPSGRRQGGPGRSVVGSRPGRRHRGIVCRSHRRSLSGAGGGWQLGSDRTARWLAAPEHSSAARARRREPVRPGRCWKSCEPRHGRRCHRRWPRPAPAADHRDFGQSSSPRRWRVLRAEDGTRSRPSGQPSRASHIFDVASPQRPVRDR